MRSIPGGGSLCLVLLLLFPNPIQAQQTFSLAGTSEIRISGTSTLRDWTVTGTNMEGRLTFAPEEKSNGAASTIVRAEVALPVASILSERGATMDSKVYQALKGEEHSVIRFYLKKPVVLRADVHAQHKMKAEGTLSIAGVTKPFICEMVLTRHGDSWTFSGKRTARMSAFDVTPPTAMFGQIVTDDDIEIEISLTFRPAAGQP